MSTDYHGKASGAPSEHFHDHKPVAVIQKLIMQHPQARLYFRCWRYSSKQNDCPQEADTFMEKGRKWSKTRNNAFWKKKYILFMYETGKPVKEVANERVLQV